jgi:hypothetical protein
MVIEWFWCTVKDTFLPLIIAWVLSPNKDTTTVMNSTQMAIARIDKSQIVSDITVWNLIERMPLLLTVWKASHTIVMR